MNIHATNSLFIVNTLKSFDHACVDLEAAVINHGFGLMTVHDLGETLRAKGINFTESCRVFEVCNPKQAAKVLEHDISMNMALPCRISIYTDAGQTRIGMIRPGEMLLALSTDHQLIGVAQEVDASTSAMINEAARLTERVSEEAHQK
jgi:uncharacterized protein (DUF302 family)